MPRSLAESIKNSLGYRQSSCPYRRGWESPAATSAPWASWRFRPAPADPVPCFSAAAPEKSLSHPPKNIFSLDAVTFAAYCIWRNSPSDKDIIAQKYLFFNTFTILYLMQHTKKNSTVIHITN